MRPRAHPGPQKRRSGKWVALVGGLLLLFASLTAAAMLLGWFK